MQLSRTNCLQSKDRGKIVHEVGHVIGFFHEHQRPDRDKYVEIFWDNLIDSEVIKGQYKIVDYARDLGTKYDYNSIMHYGPLDNTANGNVTMMVRKERFQDTFGRRTRPSSLDYRQANLLYTCPELGKIRDKCVYVYVCAVTDPGGMHWVHRLQEYPQNLYAIMDKTFYSL